MLRRLCLVYQHHGGWLIGSNLPHQLTANATGSTSYQDALLIQQFTHRLHVHIDFISRQQVLDAHFLQLETVCGFHLSVLDLHLFRSLRHEDLDVLIYQLLLKILLISEIIHQVRRNKQGINALLVDDVNDIVFRAVHFLAHHKLVAVIIPYGNKAFYHKASRILRTHTLRQSDAILLHAID